MEPAFHFLIIHISYRQLDANYYVTKIFSEKNLGAKFMKLITKTWIKLIPFLFSPLEFIFLYNSCSKMKDSVKTNHLLYSNFLESKETKQRFKRREKDKVGNIYIYIYLLWRWQLFWYLYLHFVGPEGMNQLLITLAWLQIDSALFWTAK